MSTPDVIRFPAAAVSPAATGIAVSFLPQRPTLVISTGDQAFALSRVLEGIALQRQRPAEVLVIQDGVAAQVREMVDEWRPQLGVRMELFSFAPDAFTRSRAINTAVRASTGDYLIFLDGDCVPERRFIEDHLAHAERGKFVQGRRGAIRARYVPRFSARHMNPIGLLARGALYEVRRGIRRPWPDIRVGGECRIQGANFGVWRDDFFRVNGYDEEIFGHVHADAEFAARLCNAGLTSKRVVGQLVVYHLDHPRVVRYLTAANQRLLERTRSLKLTWCERGVEVATTNAPAASTTALAV